MLSSCLDLRKPWERRSLRTVHPRILRATLAPSTGIPISKKYNFRPRQVFLSSGSETHEAIAIYFARMRCVNSCWLRRRPSEFDEYYRKPIHCYRGQCYTWTGRVHSPRQFRQWYEPRAFSGRRAFVEDVHYGRQRWLNRRGNMFFAGHGDSDCDCAGEFDDYGQ